MICSYICRGGLDVESRSGLRVVIGGGLGEVRRATRCPFCPLPLLSCSVSTDFASSPDTTHPPKWPSCLTGPVSSFPPSPMQKCGGWGLEELRGALFPNCSRPPGRPSPVFPRTRAVVRTSLRAPATLSRSLVAGRRGSKRGGSGLEELRGAPHPGSKQGHF